MEHWPFHDVIFGAITVCSSFPGILGHIIKQMMSTRQSIIQFTHKPSALLVLTLPTISYFHVECLIANRLSRHLDPGGSRYACWVLNSKHLAGTINISFMNLPLDLNVWGIASPKFLQLSSIFSGTKESCWMLLCRQCLFFVKYHQLFTWPNNQLTSIYHTFKWSMN
jgi:hypothetical protein